MSLQRQIALVTGASRGIGHAIALRLAAAGATVVGTATSQAGVERIEAALAEHGYAGGAQVLDVAEPRAIEAAVKEINDTYGAVTILVNNAGVTRDNLVVRMKDAEWAQLIDTNLSAVYRLCKTCLRGMMKARGGRIINITSVVGLTGNAGQSNYAATKAGVIGFSKSLAREVGGRAITVNTVAPGFIDTDMTRAFTAEQRSELLKQIPLERLGEPREVAEVVAFLASPAAGYITGETLHVNGGMYMP